MEAVQVGGLHLGDAWPLAAGAALCHSFGLVHPRASGRYHLAWVEATREGPGRLLYTASSSLHESWPRPRTLYTSDEPVSGVQLASSGPVPLGGGGGKEPVLFLSWQPLGAPGQRGRLLLLRSADGGDTWDGPHLVREDEPTPMGGQVPPMDPPGGPGIEHLLAVCVGSQNRWALVATDRFIEWTLALRPGGPEGWGETRYLGLRHHMPFPAALAEDVDGSLTVVTLRTPMDFADAAAAPSFPQVHAIKLDPAATEAGQPAIEDYLQLHYHADELYRLWLQCRVDGRDMARRPFISGVHKALSLRRGLVIESYRPYVRPGSGVPRTLHLMGRGQSRPVAIQDVASNRGNRYYQERGKDRYPDTQGFQIVPDGLQAADVKPGMVLVSPGWGQATHRFTADLMVPSAGGELPARALFGFWSHNFAGAVLRTMPPDPEAADSVSCRVIVELDEEVVLEDGLQFPVLVAESVQWPDRGPLVVGYATAPGSGYRLLAMGRVTGIPSSARHITQGPVL